MTFIKYIIFLSLFICSSAQAQQSDIVVSGQMDGKNLIVSWVPKNDTLWAQGNYHGYKVIREESNGIKTTLADGLKPKSKAWFEKNKTMDNGFIYVIGQVLYDPNFAGSQSRDLLDNRQIQYNYLVPEAIRSNLVADALGLSFIDKNCVEGVSYKYVISFIDSLGVSYSGTLEVSNDKNPGSFNRSALNDMIFDAPGGNSLFSMRTDLPEINRIEVVAKSYRDSVVLRWAPNNHVYWSKTKSEPYAIFRIESIVEGDSVYSKYVFLDSIQPWPVAGFTPEMIGKDSLILIAAQSMYGPQESTNADGFIIQHSESVMKYGMALLSADRSSLAATALGLRYTDNNVKPGENYSYVIMTRAADNVLENGYIDITNVPDTLDKIQSFYAEPQDGSIKLLWSQLNDQRYSGYIIDRSRDSGKSFQSLNSSPLLIIQNQFSRSDGNYHYLDSVGSDPKNYFYRIRGIDAFGDTSIAVTVSSAVIDKKAPDMPVVYFAEADLKGKIILKWEMPPGNEDLEKFHILLAESIDGSYETIATQLNSTTRTYSYENNVTADRSYYFVVVAEDKSGNQKACLPVFVQLIDSQAPAAPIHLQGFIDSSGVATITWDHNTEKDVIGYRIYMANNPDHEFSQITKEATSLNMWRDSIALIALDKFVFYKVVAVDKSNNHSPFSAILKLNRPDVIPPAAPASLPSVSDSKGIGIFWSLSPSNDVVAYIIYRRDVTSGDSTFQRIIRIQSNSTDRWVDSSANVETIYEYVIKAQDRSGLLSEYSFPVKGRRNFDFGSLMIEGLEATYKKEYDGVYLRWNKQIVSENKYSVNYQYYLYKKVNDSSWVKVKQLEASASSWLDKGLKVKGKYSYGIKIVMKDGKSGTLCESQSITID